MIKRLCLAAFLLFPVLLRADTITPGTGVWDAESQRYILPLPIDPPEYKVLTNPEVSFSEGSPEPSFILVDSGLHREPPTPIPTPEPSSLFVWNWTNECSWRNQKIL